MYYEEKFENGKAWERSSPDGVWTEITPERLWNKYKGAERTAAIYNAALEKIEKCARHPADHQIY